MNRFLSIDLKVTEKTRDDLRKSCLHVNELDSLIRLHINENGFTCKHDSGRLHINTRKEK